MVHSVLDLLNIRDLAMRDFDELSAGQHQKVMIARGLVQEPKILLDEPTANLDVRNQMDVTRILRMLSAERGILIIMISHGLNIVAKYSDNTVMMSEGRVHAVGKPFDVLTKDNVKAVYGVDCRAVDDQGRPHIIVEDPEFDGRGIETCSGSYLRADTVVRNCS